MLIRPTALILVMLASTFASVTTAAAATPSSGLLVSHTSGDSWQVRLISGPVAQKFSGTVDSSTAFASVSSVKLESKDSAVLSSPKTLSFAFATYPNRSDGADFSVPAGAKLCLRNTGSSSAPIYIGATLADAVAVSAPVSLAGTDACGGTQPPPTKRKFHTGHYIVLMRANDDQSVMTASLKPGVVGFVKRYAWRSLEPALGTYDFAEIQSDLNWAAAYGMHLIVMIEDKTFLPERPTPAYLDSYTLPNNLSGYTVARWSPYVVTRLNALVKALGRFDSNAAFEGIATQESALSLDDATLNANDYTPEKYRDSYIDTLTAATTSLPTSRVFWFMNFLARNQNYIASIVDAVASKGVVMGGPDVMPDDAALQSRTYPFYNQFQGKLPFFIQVEPVCYAHLHKTSGYTTKYWTTPELFNYAVDNLHVNYMFWVRLPKASPADAYDWLDAVPVIGNNPVFTP